MIKSSIAILIINWGDLHPNEVHGPFGLKLWPSSDMGPPCVEATEWVPLDDSPELIVQGGIERIKMFKEEKSLLERTITDLRKENTTLKRGADKRTEIFNETLKREKELNDRVKELEAEVVAAKRRA